MTDGLSGIIAELERQKTAIERALAALRDVDESEAQSTSSSIPAKTTEHSPTAREPTDTGSTAANGRSEGQKARWAAKKAAPAAVPAKAARKGRLTEEGRQKLAEAMKRRWAAKRAGSAVKKARKKAA